MILSFRRHDPKEKPKINLNIIIIIIIISFVTYFLDCLFIIHITFQFNSVFIFIKKKTTFSMLFTCLSSYLNTEERKQKWKAHISMIKQLCKRAFHIKISQIFCYLFIIKLYLLTWTNENIQTKKKCSLQK